MMDVFQLLDNNPLLGYYRVKMALDSLTPRSEERPLPTTAPHQV